MMMRLLAALVAVLLVPVFADDADAKPRKKRNAASYEYSQDDEDSSSEGDYASPSYNSRKRQRAARSRYRSEERMSLGHSEDSDEERSYSGVGPKPDRWCGWWMRTQRGGGPEYNVAWNWRNYGSPGSPQVGAVVVWPHHVGQIVGQTSSGQWIVQSGNDGGRVRTRPRSISGAVIRI